jgi:hypothetical protein
VHQLQQTADTYSDASSLNTTNQKGLPNQLKTGVEALSGYSMDDVKVHYNSAAPAQFQALAYAKGIDIHIGPGQEKHLPHEAWHVVQQKQGRVKPTRQLKGSIGVNDDQRLEKEADVMGAKAMQFLRKPGTQIIQRNSKEGGIIQMVDLPSVGPGRGSATRNHTEPESGELSTPVQRSPRRLTQGEIKALCKLENRKVRKVTGVVRTKGEDNEKREEYLPPGLSEKERKEKRIIGDRDIKRVKENIKSDYDYTEKKIEYITGYLADFNEGEYPELYHELGVIKEIQIIWLEKIVAYSKRFDLGLQAVFSRSTRDGALKSRAFERSGSSSAEKFGHLAPIASAIYSFLTNVFN